MKRVSPDRQCQWIGHQVVTVPSSLNKALALKNTPLFAPLTAEDIIPVAHLCTDTALDAGDILFREGELGNAMYVIIRGAVRIERDRQVIATLGEGECVGEMAALDLSPRSATVIAETRTTLIRLDRQDLLDLLIDHVKLAESLAMVLVDRIRGTSNEAMAEPL